MASATAARATLYASCQPLQCPKSSVFDLDLLVQTSTQREEDADDDSDACDEAGVSTVEDSTGTNPELIRTTDAPSKPSKKRRNYGHWLRSQKRDKEIRELGHIPHPKTLKTLLPHALEAARPCALDYTELPATNGAYSAKMPKQTTADRVYTLNEIKELGFTVFPWDGRRPVPFVDAEGRVFMVLAGRPDDKPWDKKTYTQTCDDAYRLLECAGHKASFTSGNRAHRRGNYPVINVGVTHGMGTLQPTQLDVRPNGKIVEELLASPDIQRIASYASASFKLWSPKTYEYYKEHLDPVFESPHLRKNFPRSVFPAAAFNCGGSVCTKKHKDGKNCPFGCCTVTSLGRFNPKTGGHLILWELGIAVEFPPGSTILLPSATISHSNTPVLDGEVRASFTQYASGGLFRWVDYGFQTEASLKTKNPELYQEMLRLRPTRWQTGVSLFSKLEDLRKRQPEGK